MPSHPDLHPKPGLELAQEARTHLRSVKEDPSAEGVLPRELDRVLRRRDRQLVLDGDELVVVSEQKA